MTFEEYVALKKQTKLEPSASAIANDWYRDLELAIDTVKRLMYSGYDNPLMVNQYKQKFPEPPAVIMSFLARQLSLLSFSIIGEARIFNDWPKMPQWGDPPQEKPLEDEDPSNTGC